MTTASELAKIAVTEAMQKAADLKLSEDALARALVTEAIGIFRLSRNNSDIASELEFIAEHLDEDEQYTFMRP
ncbi:hypothetical protein [Sneathiella limimaris]|uniref:hypothetical protein n=1 Tax=Sneathiella limimaris TaxID=1964213 RepID=UPI00146BBC5D|nr:hypothetical protein [Sneathiella limimaris]